MSKSPHVVTIVLFVVTCLFGLLLAACSRQQPDAAVAANDVQSSPIASITVEPRATIAPLPPGTYLRTDIEIANRSGVAGYEIGIFGSQFGMQSGEVTILGEQAEVRDWSDTFIRVAIPDVADGFAEDGLRVIPPVNHHPASAPFTVYSIAPEFLQAPATTFENVSYAKPVALSGQAPLDGDFDRNQCTHRSTGDQISPELYLTNYVCNNDLGAKFSADKNLGREATITIDFEQTLTPGTYFFQFHSRSDWSAAVPNTCPGTGYPADYVLEGSASGSADSYNVTLVSVTGNLRGNRSHQIEVPDGVRFIRMRVTHSVGDCLAYLEGYDFEVKELRLFRVIGDPTAPAAAFAIYGDSILAGAFNTFTGAANLNARVAGGYPSNIPFSPLGFAGRKAVQLAEEFDDPNELIDALEGDAIAGSAYYWGVALGTNDMTINDVDDIGFNEMNSHFNLFDESIEEDFVQFLIERGRVPIIARMPDTNEAFNGFGFIEAKIKILEDIDRISAEYRLIPGPDLYTEFRLNIERDNGSWISTDDGTHLTQPTHWIQFWADSFDKALSLSQ